MGEEFTLSGDSGAYTVVAANPLTINEGQIVVRASEDGTTTNQLSGTTLDTLYLLADASSALVTPLTTLLELGVEDSVIKNSFDINEAIDLTSFNPYDAVNIGSNEGIKVQQAHAQYTTTIRALTELVSTLKDVGQTKQKVYEELTKALASTINPDFSIIEFEHVNSVLANYLEDNDTDEELAEAMEDIREDVVQAIVNVNFLLSTQNVASEESILRVAYDFLSQNIREAALNPLNAYIPLAANYLVAIGEDDEAAVFSAVQGTILSSDGFYGTLSSDGIPLDGVTSYTYTLNPNRSQLMSSEEYYVESFIIEEEDGEQYTVKVIVYGGDDPAVIGGVTTGAVSDTPGQGTVTDILTSTDPDALDSDNEFIPLPSLQSDNRYGQYSVSSEGAWVYTLNPGHVSVLRLVEDEVLQDSFVVYTADYTEQDIEITITGTNNAPVAVSDSFTIAEDEVVELSVLSNDGDPEGASIEIESFTQPRLGTLRFLGNKTLEFIMRKQLVKLVFYYRITDGTSMSSYVSNNITITSVNDTPVGVLKAVCIIKSLTLIILIVN